MKQDNYNLTQTISDLYEQAQNIPDRVFYITDGHNYCKVTTKTLKLACKFAEEFESTVFDTWASDEDFCCYGNWEGSYQEIDYDNIIDKCHIYNLDTYDFEYCKYPDYL